MEMYQDSAFLLGVMKGELHTVKYHLHAGANINARGGVALTIAAERGDLTMVRYLYSQGARSDEAYSAALEYGHEEVAEFLLDMSGASRVEVVSSRGDLWNLVARYS